jgi:hypothetical protein
MDFFKSKMATPVANCQSYLALGDHKEAEKWKNIKFKST